MISVEEIKQKALRRYDDYLRSIITANSLFFPLNIPGNKENEKDIAVLQKQQIVLFENEKSNVGFGYTLQTEFVSNKRGKIHSIKRIVFETELDYLKFIDKESNAASFKSLLKTTLAEFPELAPLLRDKPNLLSENPDKWPDLIKVCSYFKQTPQPGLYIRELPVPVHTKFIEDNTGVLEKLLSVIIHDHIHSDGHKFEGRFNLKTKHNLIRIRFLENSLSPLPGFSEIGIAETEIDKLKLNCKRVFIIENDVTALTFPRVDNAIIIFGKGYHVVSLKQIEWLNSTELFYWSDIDKQGFEMLAQIRSYFPKVQSFLMDKLSFENFKEFAVTGTETKNSPPVNLNPEEQKMYQFLSSENIRLEQERIPIKWIDWKLASLPQ